VEQAREFLDEARRLAEDLGEELQQAKVVHAKAGLAERTGDLTAALDLVRDSRERFVKCGTPYDVAYADLSLARILAPSRPREAIERLAEGRSAVERGRFTLLRRFFPELGPPMADRILAGLVAYAAGDGFGVPWEGRAPHEIPPAALDSLPVRAGWAAGSTSDDTALTLLVAEHLARERGLGDPLRFLAALAERAPQILGLGPSTMNAIEHFRRTGEPDPGGGDTNGAPMRALPVGWAVPPSAALRRREWTLELTRMTHGGAAARTAACVMSACASWAVEGAPVAVLLEVAEEEAAAVGPDTAVLRAVQAVRGGRWVAPAAGISLDPAETVGAVLHCLASSGDDLDGALRAAVALGGDTDTVAALVGGLLGSRLGSPEVRARLTWLDRVALPPADRIAGLAAELAGVRLAGDG
jgi:ADP-ribosyl-[dinitrogen reductase] hydrolase